MIGTSTGQTYDDEGQFNAAQWDPKTYAPSQDSSDTGLTPDALKTSTLPDISDVPEHDWVDNAIKSFGQALKYPGDVMQGNKPVSVEGITNMGMNLMGAPALIAEKAEAGTLGSFAGLRSKTVDTNAAKLAETAEEQGFNADEIHKATGFFRGADGKWRYEIDDSNAKLNPDNFRDYLRPLSEVLDHPELYDAYPQLKNIGVRVDPNYPTNGAVNNGNYILFGMNASKDLGTVLHEVMHNIQDYEGFAKGGQADRNPKLKYEDAVNSLRSEWLDMQTQMLKNPSSSKFDAAFFNRYDHLRDIFNKYAEYARAGKQQAFDNYQALAGEAEARNVETRLLLNQNQRMDKFPQDTEDTYRKDQIVSPIPVRTTPYTNKDPAYLHGYEPERASVLP